MKKSLKLLLLSVAAMAVLFVGLSALAFHLVDIDALVREQVAAQKPAIEEALGREVSIGEVKTRFFPSLGATVEGIEIAPAAEGEESPLRLREAGFSIDLLGALLSLGREVRVDGIWVDGLRVTVVRHADGKLSIDDLLERPAAAEEEKEDAGESGDLASILGRISIDSIELRDGAIALIDEESGVRGEVSRLQLRMQDVRLEDPISVQLTGAAFADEPNFVFAARIGPFAPDLSGTPPLRDLVAHIDGVDLSPALPLLASELRTLVVSADLQVPSFVANERVRIDGFVALDAFQFEGREKGTARLEADLDADPAKLDVDVRKLVARIGSAELRASGKLHDLAAAPRFEDFLVEGEGIDPAPLLALLPEGSAALPPGAQLAGPVELRLSASGDAKLQKVDGVVDLTAVDVKLPDTFVKPAGVPLALRLDGDLSPTKATLRQLGLRLDELDLRVAGTVEDFAQPHFDLKAQAAPFSFDRLVRLLPAAASGLAESQARASGKGSIEGYAKGSASQLDTRLALSFTGVSLTLPDTKIEGAATLLAEARGNPGGDLHATLRLDAGDSVIRIPGKLDKAASTPLSIDVVADKRGNRIDFSRFEMRLAELMLQGEGAIGDDAALELRLLPLDLQRFARTVPSLPAFLSGGGNVEARASVRGDPDRPETIRLQLSKLALRLGQSDLQASATIENLQSPVIEVDARSRLLDLDALFPESEEGKEEVSDSAPREDSPELKKLVLTASFEGGRVRTGGRELRDVVAKLSIRDGVLTVDRARFGVYGGEVDATGTRATIWRGKMPWSARLAVKNVEVAQLLAGEFDGKGLLTGRANFGLQLEGEGFEKTDLEEHLTGLWDFSLLQGRLQVAPVSKSLLGGLASAPGFDRKKLDGSSGELRDLFAGFAVENGKMTLREPMKMKLDGNEVELAGAVGITGQLFLDGSYALEPSTLAALTGGRCRLDAPAQLPLSVRGKAAKPEIGTDGKVLAAVAARSCVSGQVGKALDALGGKAAAAEIDEAKARAEAAASKLEEEAARAKAEAERRKAEAEKKAKEKAREGANKLKKRLGF